MCRPSPPKVNHQRSCASWVERSNGKTHTGTSGARVASNQRTIYRKTPWGEKRGGWGGEISRTRLEEQSLLLLYKHIPKILDFSALFWPVSFFQALPLPLKMVAKWPHWTTFDMCRDFHAVAYLPGCGWLLHTNPSLTNYLWVSSIWKITRRSQTL